MITIITGLILEAVFTMASLTNIALLLSLLPLLAECGPWCFKCDDAFHPAVCQEVIACGQHENCYAEKHSNNNGAETFSSGCKPIGDCSVVKRAAVHCSECCTSTLCNEVLCASTSISNKTRMWCADCSLQSDPSACDHVDLCSQDQACSVTKKTVFGFTTYDLGCEDKKQCQGKTLNVDQQQCCDSHLCNTNLAGVSPDLYTSPLPSTTTPTPAAATATINETNIDYVSHHLGNETLQITCLISGFPTPNVTWFFTPHSTGSANTTGSGNTTGNTGTAVSGTVATATNSLAANVTTGKNNSTTGGNSTIASNTTAGLNSTVGNAQGGVTSVQITSGVTTNGNVSVLEITSPDGGDAGEYTCHVENKLGPFDTAVTVTYAEVPVISGASNMTLQGDARDDVILDCDVDGSPTPDLEWQVPPGAGGVERLSNGSLLLHNVHADSAGDYVCLANNTVGTAVKTFSLSVHDNSTPPCPTAAVLITTLPPTATTSTTLTTSTIPSTTTDQTTVTTPPPTPVTCPTLPPTTTPQSTTSTTSSPASSTLSSTLTTSTPATTTTATTSTTTAATTSETTTTATSPSTTSTTATTLSTTTSSTPMTTTTTMTTGPPMVHAVGSLFHSSDGDYVVLQCAVPLSPGVTSSPPVTWSRLASDYDHSDTKSYTENGHGVLVIAPQPHSVTTYGVYVCHVAMGSPNDKAEFVVYKDVPGPIDCRQEFNVGNPSVGMVLRTTCGPCQLAPLQTSRLIWRDQICNSAVGRGVIPQSGGTVTWLLKTNNEVDLLTEQNGHVMHTT